jgi:site-specific recombinase XerD
MFKGFFGYFYTPNYVGFYVGLIMGKLLSMKGLTENNGTWSYTRTIPKALIGHPSFRGRKNYRKQLISASASYDQVIQSWKQAHEDFEQYIDDLKNSNISVIERNELIKRAEVFLRVNGLKSGMLADDEALTERDNNQHHADLKLMIGQSGMFDELDTFSSRTNYENTLTPFNSFETSDLSAQVQIQDYAWKVLTQPASSNKVQFLLSDCWLIYVTKRGLDESTRETKRTKSCFLNFINIVGDHIISDDAVDTALMRYVDERESIREDNMAKGCKASPSPSSIERELNSLLSIIRTTIKKHRLKVVVERPEVRMDIEANERHTFSSEEQIKLVKIASDLTQNDYQSYKELMFLLMIQTGTHITELLRLKRYKVKISHKIPHLILDGELKTKQRRRVLPLVFKVERIQELAAMFEDDSEYFFGEVNSKRTADNYSAQLNKVCKRVNPKSTSYSCRHSFKHHAVVKGIDAQMLANLGGWSGKDSGLSKQMLSYGSSGLLNEESLLVLQSAMMLINEHLIDAESKSLL